MKRILTLLAAVTMLMAGLSAQTRALATLSHNGQLTFFDSVYCLEDAIEAAVDDDIIYLSEGRFIGNNYKIIIANKKISIVGCGYKTHISTPILFLSETPIKLTSPLLDGVRLESISFEDYHGEYSYDFKSIDNVEIKNSYMTSISDSEFVNSLKLVQCRIDYPIIYYPKTRIINSKIISVFVSPQTTFENNAILENCNIKRCHPHCDQAIILNCVIGEVKDRNHGRLAGIYKNCLIGDGSKFFESDECGDYIVENCYFISETAYDDLLDENLECTVDLSDYKGTDGDVIGIYGGKEGPYSETASVPTVDSCKSSFEYDEDSNKLNVTITVAPHYGTELGGDNSQ